MKYGVIDIGSNSVRLMINGDGIIPVKKIRITQLASGMGESRILTEDAMRRTANAVLFFVNFAREERVDEIFIFATAAVRNSLNKDTFIDLVKEETGFDIDVVSGELEGKLGHLGVFSGKDGGVIDIGGASSEITVYYLGKCVYSRSIPIGAVNLTGLCGQDLNKIKNLLSTMLNDYGNVPKSTFRTIGGTACNVCSVMQELSVFEPSKVDGFEIGKTRLKELINKVSSLTIEERKNIVGLQVERAENFLSGLLILDSIMDYLSIDKVFHSEKDNLEGYLNYKTENL